VAILIGFRYYPKNKGKVTGLIMSAVGVSPILFGEFFTLVTNPNNEGPSHSVRSGKEKEYYYPESVYQNVPRTLLIWAVLLAALTFVAAVLVTPYAGPERRKPSSPDSDSELEPEENRDMLLSSETRPEHLRPYYKNRVFYFIFAFTALALSFGFWT
jgi:hypothetical protein